MRIRYLLIGCLLMIVVLTSHFYPTKAVATNNLIGTWKLVLYEDQPPGEQPEYPYGRHPIGLLIYDSTGHMAVQIMKPHSSKILSGKKRADKLSERPSLDYTAYFGTYTVDWTKHIVIHNVEGNLYPIYIGTSHERPFELKGDELTLRPRWERDGKTISGVRVFERLK